MQNGLQLRPVCNQQWFETVMHGPTPIEIHAYVRGDIGSACTVGIVNAMAAAFPCTIEQQNLVRYGLPWLLANRTL